MISQYLIRRWGSSTSNPSERVLGGKRREERLLWGACHEYINEEGGQDKTKMAGNGKCDCKVGWEVEQASLV